MRILVAGFSREDMEQLSAGLRDAGHSVLGASGRSSARILARGAPPQAVLVPDGEAGVEATTWIADLLPEVPVHHAVRAGDIPGARAPGAAASVLGGQLDPGPLSAALDDTAQPGHRASTPPGGAPSRRALDVEVASVAGRVSVPDPGRPAPASTAERPDAGSASAPPDPPAATAPRQPVPPVEMPPGRKASPPDSSVAGERRPPLPSAETPPSRKAAPLAPSPASPPPVHALMAPARLDPAPVAAPLEVTSPGGAAADRPSARRQLEARLAQVRFGSYHAVLDATEDTSARAMRDSFERLRAQFSPTRWAGQVGPDDIDLLDEIARGVEDAYSVLGDPELRARYERALATTARSGHPARAR